MGEELINEILALFTDSFAVTNASSLLMVIIYIASNVGTVLIRKKLGIKDVQVDAVNNNVIEGNGEIKELRKEVGTLTTAIGLLGDMFYQTLIGSKIAPENKMAAATSWAQIKNLLEDVTVAVAPEVLEEIDKAIEEATEDNPLLQTVVDIGKEVIEEVIEQAPTYVEGLINGPNQ